MATGHPIARTSQASRLMDRVVIEGLEITCVIGAWEWERHITQKLVVDLAMGTDIAAAAASRSEERRVGKECRSRWSPYH